MKKWVGGWVGKGLDGKGKEEAHRNIHKAFMNTTPTTTPTHMILRVEVPTRRKGQESLPPQGILRAVVDLDAALVQAVGHVHVLPKAHLVGPARLPALPLPVQLLGQHLERRRIQHKPSTARVEGDRVAGGAEGPAQEDGLLPVLRGGHNLLRQEVPPEVLDDEEEVVPPDTK